MSRPRYNRHVALNSNASHVWGHSFARGCAPSGEKSCIQLDQAPQMQGFCLVSAQTKTYKLFTYMSLLVLLTVVVVLLGCFLSADFLSGVLV